LSRLQGAFCKIVDAEAYQDAYLVGLLGTKSYSHSFDLRMQLLQIIGLIISHRIFRLRLMIRTGNERRVIGQYFDKGIMEKRTHHGRQAMTTDDVSLRVSLGVQDSAVAGEVSECEPTGSL
jgi:hypothetical protein